MKLSEIHALTKEAVVKLLQQRDPNRHDTDGPRRRRLTRWPFPGTVELWIPRKDGNDDYMLATSLNLSIDGCGIQADERLRKGLEVGIAIHEPEISFHGRAVVRHCTQLDGKFVLGLEFVYPDEA